MLTFPMFDGSNDPYDHMLHYNQVMTLNACNDCLLCKVFLASLRRSALAWFHKLPCNSVNFIALDYIHLSVSLFGMTEEEH